MINSCDQVVYKVGVSISLPLVLYVIWVLLPCPCPCWSCMLLCTCVHDQSSGPIETNMAGAGLFHCKQVMWRQQGCEKQRWQVPGNKQEVLNVGENVLGFGYQGPSIRFWTGLQQVTFKFIRSRFPQAICFGDAAKQWHTEWSSGGRRHWETIQIQEWRKQAWAERS